MNNKAKRISKYAWVIVLSLIICHLTFGISACANQDTPPTAQAFIKKYFPHSSIVLVETDSDDEDTGYSVWLNDGSKIDFDLQGNWKRVARKKSGVPAILIPQDITQYVKTNYPEEVIFKLSKKPYGYKIELSNDMDLRFNSQCQFMEVVD
jgi:hypothetical protein